MTIDEKAVQAMGLAMELGHAWVTELLDKPSETPGVAEALELLRSEGRSIEIAFPISELKGQIQVRTVQPDGSWQLLVAQDFEFQEVAETEG